MYALYITTPKMVSGFVPKVQHHFGKRYTENCISAISEFEGDQRQHNQRIAELRLSAALASGKMERKNFADLELPVNNRQRVTSKPCRRFLLVFHNVKSVTVNHTESVCSPTVSPSQVSGGTLFLLLCGSTYCSPQYSPEVISSP